MVREDEIKAYFASHRFLPLERVTGFVVPTRGVIRSRFASRDYVIEYRIGTERPSADMAPLAWVREGSRAAGMPKTMGNRYVIHSRSSLEESVRDLKQLAETRLLTGPPGPPVSREQMAEFRRMRDG